MSLKRYKSSDPFTQPSIADYQFSQDMPLQRKSTKRYNKKKYNFVKNKVPRAIATRGTANGYHEFNHHRYTKLYFKTTGTGTFSGFYNTDQTTGAYSGSPQRGVQLNSVGDSFYCNIGEGATVTTIAQGMSNWAELAAVFDNYKVVSESYEFWFALETKGPADATTTGINLIMVKDPNTNLPPVNEGDVIQYNRQIWIKGVDQFPKKVYNNPFILVDTSRDMNGTAASDFGLNLEASKAGYISTKNNLTMFSGMKGWLSIVNSGVGDISGYLFIKRVQKRRYKNQI